MLYNVESPVNKAMTGMNQAAGTYGSMMKNIPKQEPEKPEPTVGGAMMSGMGAMGTAAMVGETAMGAEALTAIGMTGAPGLAAAAAIGIGAYLLS